MPGYTGGNASDGKPVGADVPGDLTEHGRCNLMRSSREGAAGSPMEASETGPSSITDSDDPLMLRPTGPGVPGGPQRLDGAGTAGGPDGTGRPDGQQATAAGCLDGDDSAEPLTESDAEAVAHGICFKTGPPGGVGVELEWLVCDGRDPAVPVDQQRVATALARLDGPGALPGRGVLTTEPGGQIETQFRASGGSWRLRRRHLPGPRRPAAGDTSGGSVPDRAGTRPATARRSGCWNCPAMRRWRNSSTGPARGAG